MQGRGRYDGIRRSYVWVRLVASLFSMWNVFFICHVYGTCYLYATWNAFFAYIYGMCSLCGMCSLYATCMERVICMLYGMRSLSIYMECVLFICNVYRTIPHTHTRTHKHVHMHTHTNTHTHSHTHTHTHSHTLSLSHKGAERISRRRRKPARALKIPQILTWAPSRSKPNPKP